MARYGSAGSDFKMRRVTDSQGRPGYVYFDDAGNQTRVHASEQAARDELAAKKQQMMLEDNRPVSSGPIIREQISQGTARSSEVMEMQPVSEQGMMQRALAQSRPPQSEAEAKVGPAQRGRTNSARSEPFMMEERFSAPSRRNPNEQTISVGPNSDIERRMTGTEGPRMTPEGLKKFAARQQIQRVQGGGAQSEAEDKLGPEQRGRRAPLMEGVDTSVGMVGEQPSEEQLGMLGRNPALAGINQAQQDRQKSAMEADVSKLFASDAGLMNTQRQQPKQPDNPASAELAQLNAEAVSKNPAKKAKAQKEREGLFAGLSKEERAFAKEELGNYYVDPLSGHAVNLDAMAASDKRAADMALLQYVPEHQRVGMLAKMGYIDPEDVKDLPESDAVRVAELNAATALAQTEMKESGSSSRQTEQLQFQYKSLGDKTNIEQRKLDILKENGIKDRELKKYGIDKQYLANNDANALQLKIATMNDATKWKIADRGYQIDDKKANILREMGVREWDFKELALDADNFNKMEDRDLREYIADKKIELEGRSISVQEKQIDNDYKIQNRNLDIRNTLGLKELEFKELNMRVQEDIAMGKLDLEELLGTMNIQLSQDKLAQVQQQFDANIELQYEQLSAKTDYEDRLLATKDRQFLLEHNQKSQKQKQAYILAEKAQDMSMFKELLGSGQVEAAFMMAESLDLDPAFMNIDDFWKSKAKKTSFNTSISDAIKLATGYEGATDEKLLRDGHKRYLNAKKDYWKTISDNKVDSEGDTPVEKWMRENNIQPFDPNSSESSDPRIGYHGGRQAGFMAKVKMAMLNEKLSRDPQWSKTHRALMMSEMPKLNQPTASGDDTVGDTGETTETGQPPPAVDTSGFETQDSVEGSNDQEVEQILFGASDIESTLKVSPEGLEGQQKQEYQNLLDTIRNDVKTAKEQGLGTMSQKVIGLKGLFKRLKMLSEQAQERRRARLRNR